MLFSFSVCWCLSDGFCRVVCSCCVHFVRWDFHISFLLILLFFFFFKQKTAYEMRISDWSSDVCSSDLAGHRRFAAQPQQRPRRLAHRAHRVRHAEGDRLVHGRRPRRAQQAVDGFARGLRLAVADEVGASGARRTDRKMLERIEVRLRRSAEHTSELQSLMCISYAV